LLPGHTSFWNPEFVDAHDKIPPMKITCPHLLCIILFSFFFFMLSSCASPTPIPSPVPHAAPGTVLFKDEFDASTTGWDRFANDGGIMDYFNGGFRILVQKPSLNFWSTPQKNFGDVRIEADAVKLAGPDENRMGLMCRYQGGNYYFFIISDDGFFAIGKFIKGQTILLGQEEMLKTPLIQAGAVNHLRTDCIGSALTFYLNGNQVAIVQDGDLKSGDVGVLAGSFSQPGVDVSFDHFVVTQP
jgi:hypothetical protein